MAVREVKSVGHRFAVRTQKPVGLLWNIMIDWFVDADGAAAEKRDRVLQEKL